MKWLMNTELILAVTLKVISEHKHIGVVAAAFPVAKPQLSDCHQRCEYQRMLPEEGKCTEFAHLCKSLSMSRMSHD